MMWRLRNWLFGGRRVAVTDFDGDAKILRVRQCPHGLYVNWHGLSNTWSKLQPDGTLTGYGSDRYRWEPFDGWFDCELNSIDLFSALTHETRGKR